MKKIAYIIISAALVLGILLIAVADINEGHGNNPITTLGTDKQQH